MKQVQCYEVGAGGMCEREIVASMKEKRKDPKSGAGERENWLLQL